MEDNEAPASPDPIQLDEDTRGLIPWLLAAFAAGPLIAAALFVSFVDPGLKHRRLVAAASARCAQLKGPEADCSRAAIEDQLRGYRSLETRPFPETHVDPEQLRAAAEDIYLLDHTYLIPIVAPGRAKTAAARP